MITPAWLWLQPTTVDSDSRDKYTVYNTQSEYKMILKCTMMESMHRICTERDLQTALFFNSHPLCILYGYEFRDHIYGVSKVKTWNR